MTKLIALTFLLISCVSQKGEPLWEIQIERGDTLQKIADRFEVSVKDILDHNSISNPNFLEIGQVLAIPRHTFFDDDGDPVWPLIGKITSGFGKRNASHHDGIDIAAKHGRRIVSALPGTVIFSGVKNGYGKTVVIDHGDEQTLYAHCSRIFVNVGQFIEKAQVIAHVGDSGRAYGAHLHFEVRDRDGIAMNPMELMNH